MGFCPIIGLAGKLVNIDRFDWLVIQILRFLLYTSKIINFLWKEKTFKNKIFGYGISDLAILMIYFLAK